METVPLTDNLSERCKKTENQTSIQDTEIAIPGEQSELMISKMAITPKVSDFIEKGR